jgi:hypothetical protein
MKMQMKRTRTRGRVMVSKQWLSSSGSVVHCTVDSYSEIAVSMAVFVALSVPCPSALLPLGPLVFTKRLANGFRPQAAGSQDTSSKMLQYIHTN